jgi:diguanylate cyclase (GGDEF)-like protein/PAS domain S-box-containing protein
MYFSRPSPRREPRARSRSFPRLLSALTLLLCAFSAQAYQRDLYFRHLDSRDGLAQNSIRVLFQDAHGYIWLGTQGGLHRYDGYTLRRYRHDPGRKDSLPDNMMTALADADGGYLWVGSTGGLSLLDPVHDRVMPLPASVSRPRLIVDRLRGLPDGTLLIGTVEGIDRLSGDQGTYTMRRLWAASENQPVRGLDFAGHGTRVLGFARCPDGGIYAATVAGVLSLGADAAHTRVLARTAAPVNAIFCDARNHLLIGDRGGLQQIDRASGAQSSWWSAVPPQARRGVTAIAQDHQGVYWMTLPGAGLLRFDRAGGSTRLEEPVPGVPGTLPETGVNRLLVDHSGLLWVGTYTEGVAWTDPSGAVSLSVQDLSPAAREAGANHINGIAETRDGNFWLSTGRSGLRRYDPATDAFSDFGAALQPPAPAHAPAGQQAAAAAPYDFIYELVPDGDGLLLASTRGLLRLNESEEKGVTLTPVAFGDPAVEGWVQDGVRKVLRARNGDLWLALLRHGLLQIHAGKLVRHYQRVATGDELSDDAVLNLAEDLSGRIWAGTANGVSLIYPESGRVRTFREVPGHADSLAGRTVTSLRVTADGTVWVGTDSGLNRLLWLDDKGAHFARYDQQQGLPDNTVYCMLDDARGMLWFSTNLGIARLDPRTGMVRAFDLADGLQGDEYNAGACLRTREGKLVFGGSSGFDVLNPAAFRRDPLKPDVVITDMRVGGVQVPPPAANAQVEVPADARSLHLTFAALDFFAPHRNRFRYRLSGYDEGWIDAGTRHEANWTNLAAGDYVFEVSGSNRDGVYGDVTRLPIRVMAPWWSSRAMRVLYVATALLAVLAFLLIWRGKRLEELRHQKQLRLREDRLRLALWGSGDEFWDWDLQAGMMFRLGADGLPGGHREESIAIDDWRNFAVHPDDLERVEHALAEHVAGNSDHFEAEHRLMNTRGEWVWVISRGKIVERDAAGKPLRICGTARDINALRAAERDRRVAAEVIRSMTEAVTVTDLNYHFISVNPAFTRMTGYAEEEVIGRDAAMLNCRQHAPEIYHHVRDVLAETGHWRGEMWQRRKDGEEFLCWVELNEVRDSNGQPTHLVGVLTDITDRKRVEQELRYLANYDSLTGLPNRTLQGERLGHAIINARRASHKVAVLFIDLDRFKHVNDSMGHAAGDRMLKAAGARLRHVVREQDTVARLGGDEFTVILEHVLDVRDAEEMAQRLIEAFQSPLGLGGSQEVVISPSIGIAMYPDHGQVPTDLLKYADTAMYQAKERGRNTYAVYHATMDTQARDRARMIAALRRALERREFQLVYQPKMAIASGRITGAEALLRWNSSELGAIPPTVFIPLAEETGLIHEIGEFVLVSACAALKEFRDAGLHGMTMAVNLSAAQLQRAELTLRICEILAEHDIAPDQLELELTESMVMANAEQSVRILSELKSIGVRLAIDDFGTGYSSLIYLKRLPIDTLKIDREFVGDITTDPDDAAITSTIITMAHSLDLNVVAEGVETPEQLAFLRGQDCDEIQGHWLSMPLPAEECLQFIAERTELARAGA